ncbi:MAG: hypothetical protein RLW42_18695 [Gammaproteobacteria bacterium]
MPRVPSTKHPPIAVEGRTVFVGALVIVLLLVGLLGTPVLLAGVPLVALVGWFYRDPHRDSPSLPLALVAPSDGMVVAAGPTFDPWCGRDAECVSVQAGLLDVHTLFSPIEGKIVEQWSRPRHPSPWPTTRRPRIAYLVRTDEGDEVVLEIARGVVPGPVHFGYQPGERIGHGRRIGFMPAGGILTVYAPQPSRVEVDAGSRVSGASSVLMTLIHEQAVSAVERAEGAA